MNGRRAGGFTVIELLVTIAVLTIIVSMGVPMYGQFSRGSAMSGKTSDFLSSINLARSEAVSVRDNVNLVAINGDWTSGWNVVRASSGEVLRVLDARGANVSVSIVDADNRISYTFDREGRVTSNGAYVEATFTLCPNDGQPGPGRTVQMTRFGRIQLTQVACP